MAEVPEETEGEKSSVLKDELLLPITLPRKHPMSESRS
jgi:hypothetical protein